MELTPYGSDFQTQTGAMKKSRSTYASVGIAASYFAGITYQDVSYEIFKFTTGIFNIIVI
jgi:hypothetical protein